ncbi:hypothetical protein C8R43DRAFT_944943 [Mycena crocata]|nr:hypothetical protein C8R43DRAFT_944943 [Mycena crocata]
MTNFSPVAPGTGSVLVAMAQGKWFLQSAAPAVAPPLAPNAAPDAPEPDAPAPPIVGGLYIIVPTSPLMAIVEENAKGKLWLGEICRHHHQQRNALTFCASVCVSGHKTQSVAVLEFNSMLRIFEMYPVSRQIKTAPPPSYSDPDTDPSRKGCRSSSSDIPESLNKHVLRGRSLVSPGVSSSRSDFPAMTNLHECAENGDNQTLLSLLAQLHIRPDNSDPPCTPSPPPYSVFPTGPLPRPNTLRRPRPRAEPPSSPTTLCGAYPRANPTVPRRTQLSSQLSHSSSEPVYYFDSSTPDNGLLLVLPPRASPMLVFIASSRAVRTDPPPSQPPMLSSVAQTLELFIPAEAYRTFEYAQARSWVRIAGSTETPIPVLLQPQDLEDDEYNPLNGNKSFGGDSLYIEASLQASMSDLYLLSTYKYTEIVVSNVN